VNLLLMAITTFNCQNCLNCYPISVSARNNTTGVS
jgi:hypothetical protein